ncbi:hypothetical protein CTA1_654 [Colletotrichum tanaceti]|uniref:Uncharacterized protein n=1 Tax=Colletotrichum tanaceti TaxID=1306861 RepID=A0A4U6X4N7_9PEZI|nr:hypothetical protein CTA1_654 [Colletotrichum tanaceti]
MLALLRQHQQRVWMVFVKKDGNGNQVAQYTGSQAKYHSTASVQMLRTRLPFGGGFHMNE